MEDTRFIVIDKRWYKVGYRDLGCCYRKCAMHRDVILEREVKCNEIESIIDEALYRFETEGYVPKDKINKEDEQWFNSIIMRRECVSEKSVINILVYDSIEDYKSVEIIL